MKEQDTNLCIKISSELLSEIKEVAEHAGIKTSKLIRYFIQNGIRELKSGKTIEIQETFQISMKNKK